MFNDSIAVFDDEFFKLEMIPKLPWVSIHSHGLILEDLRVPHFRKLPTLHTTYLSIALNCVLLCSTHPPASVLDLLATRSLATGEVLEDQS